jgi:CheY-like chemotaxis protein
MAPETVWCSNGNYIERLFLCSKIKIGVRVLLLQRKVLMGTNAGQHKQRMAILLADDDPQVCSAIRLILEQESGTEVVGEVVDGKSLLAQLSKSCISTYGVGGNTTINSKIDGQFFVLLLDWELPGFDPVKQIPDLRVTCPKLIVVALSVQTEARQIALASGVDAFVSKSDPPDQVMAKLRALVP